MIAFIDDHRGAHGVEPICKALPIAPSTYRVQAAGRHDPAKLPARARRDAGLMPEIARVFEENFRVYRVRKVWRARCTVARLMRAEAARFTPTAPPDGGINAHRRVRRMSARETRGYTPLQHIRAQLS